MNKTIKTQRTFTSAKLHKQFLNTNFSVPVIKREKLPQLFSAPPIANEG